MDIVFRFDFYNSRKEYTPSRSLAFYAANINTNWDELYETMALCTKKMSAEYGEHRGLVMLASANLIGHNSSHIEQRDQVMEAWRAIFLNHFAGCEVSNVFDMTHVESDAEILERTKDAYEQQQAQQLRATLSANIATSAPPATTKKI